LIREDPRAETKSDFVRGHELYAQALTFENNNRPDLAEKNYLEALKYLPVFDQIYTNLGHIYIDMGKLDRALEMYNKALELNPKNHKVLLSLGYYSLEGKRFIEAENYFKQAIAISPILPGAYSGLGDVATHRGESEQAIKYYNESLRLGQDNVWLRKKLAQAYLSLEDKENAVLNWEKALKFNPLDQETKALVEKYSPRM
jgi:tetratricopeptide (TPR) repeat protein